jgi:hypothetical protein
MFTEAISRFATLNSSWVPICAIAKHILSTILHSEISSGAILFLNLSYVCNCISSFLLHAVEFKFQHSDIISQAFPDGNINADDEEDDDKNRQRSKLAEINVKVGQTEAIRDADEDVACAILLLALKMPGTDLPVVRSELNAVAANELVS